MTLRVPLKIIVALLATITLFSCNNDKDEPFEVLGDVYYINQIIDGEMQTGVAYYAFANKSIASATATPPGGETVELSKSLSYWFTWFREPEIEEYTVGYPPDGTYNFEVTSEEGDVVQRSDELEIDTLDIPVITEITYNSNQLGYDITWNKIEKANAFAVKIKNTDGDFIYSSYTLSGHTTNYTVLESGSGQWVENPVDGETYTFQIQAIRFDNDADETNYIYNFEEISIGETEVVWGIQQ